MRLPGINRSLRKKWERQKDRLGYYPHYQRIGRVLMEVRFLTSPLDRISWTVVNMATMEVHVFRKNGAPLAPGTKGRLIGPVVYRRGVKQCP
jgi:hypothetical protein